MHSRYSWHGELNPFLDVKTEIKCGCVSCEKSHNEPRVRCVLSTTNSRKNFTASQPLSHPTLWPQATHKSSFSVPLNCYATSQTKEYPPGSSPPTQSIIEEITSKDGPWVLWSLTSVCSQNPGSSSTGHPQGEDAWVSYVLLCHVPTPVVSNLCVRNVWFWKSFAKRGWEGRA